jgi:NCAIR mutase (PurE)-related protein
MEINKILERPSAGEIKIEEAKESINKLMYGDIAYLKFDSERQTRTGIPEVIFCKEKTIEHVQKIFSHASKHNLNLLGTWVSKEMAEAVNNAVPDLTYNPVGRTLVCGSGKPVNEKATVAVISGGTSDLPVVEEAADTLRFLGNKVEVFTDIGVAGIHRLFDKIERIKQANVVIAVAGMEGALASVIAGLVDKPVIGVPTSVGYGASFDGLTPLLAMLNSCAPGVSVVNIDNGFGAACQAAQINRLIFSEDKL